MSQSQVCRELRLLSILSAGIVDLVDLQHFQERWRLAFFDIQGSLAKGVTIFM